MTSLPELVYSDIKRRALFRPGQPILIGVSGGVDSMVLLHLLGGLAQAFGWKLCVAHLNHGLRGNSSNADERLVRRVARELKLPCIVSRADVRSFAKARGLSLEMAARKLRHQFLADAAIKRKIRTVALAHHLDDQVELFFLRLLRGSGSQGLAGMKWANPSPASREIILARPLLNCPKQALQDYAAEQQIPFRPDASNSSLDIQRNRVRHELLPLLRRAYQPGLNTSLVRLMNILSEESDFLAATAESWLKRANRSEQARSGNFKPGRSKELSKPAESAAYLSDSFDGLPVALQRRCLQLQLVRLGVAPHYDLIEHLRVLPETPISVGRDESAAAPEENRLGVLREGGLRLVRQGARVLRLAALKHIAKDDEFLELDLRQANHRDWHGVRLAWRPQRLVGSKRRRPQTGSEVFDADRLGPTIKLRHWRAGDRFQPIGMAQSIKLQDLFVNQKVPREIRNQLLVGSTVGGELFWVEGLRISERFKLTSGTIRRLHWHWQRL